MAGVGGRLVRRGGGDFTAPNLLFTLRDRQLSVITFWKRREGAVRQILTSLYKGKMLVPYSAQRPRHSARATERLSLKFCRE